jgi:quinol monooxygenase YgiN
MKKTLIAVLTLLTAWSCTPAPDDTKCKAEVLESDFQTIGGLTGPDVDPATGKLKPGNYVLSGTYIRLTTDPKGQAVFRQDFQGIAAILPSQPGLAAFQLATSDECLTGRTISVWKDEKSMMSFVSVPEHKQAMIDIPKMSRGGGAVTHWSDTEAGATFDTAALKLGEEPGYF